MRGLNSANIDWYSFFPTIFKSFPSIGSKNDFAPKDLILENNENLFDFRIILTRYCRISSRVKMIFSRFL